MGNVMQSPTSGGQYRSAVGISTHDQTDRERDLAAITAFEAELQRAIDGVDWAAEF